MLKKILSSLTRKKPPIRSVPIIELTDLAKSYYLSTGEEIPVLRDIDLVIQKSEFVALMGESGSGKSTLLNVIGFLHFLTGGQYLLEGEDVSELRDDESLSYIRNRKIGFIFQQFHLLPRLSVLENVALPGIYSGQGSDERFERARSLLERLGLSDKVASLPGELSGGQQQRVAIARALMNNPEILLADEPTGNLDSATTEEIMKLLVELHKQGKTIIMVTHAPDVASRADRIVRLRDGRVVN
ncbi:MAG: ABC transporter ATP-binding protein [Candidatus Gracilibacteria bacterium]|nr:ABC transporter ATP-binding protein [Candidatus Gracilibacteria bacterium]